MWLEAAQLLHEVRALHQRHVGKVQIAKYLILEPGRVERLLKSFVETSGALKAAGFHLFAEVAFVSRGLNMHESGNKYLKWRE